MIVLLFVLALMYSWARDPRSWKWFAEVDSSPVRVTTDAPGAASPRIETPPASSETTVAGPTDQDKNEWTEASKLFEAVSDRTPLAPIEMPAYWRCMKWARAQTFAQLEKRSASKIVYTRLWEEPEKYRGKLLRLRLHLRRILDYDAPKNSAGVQRVYEAWGWTDESKSFPYVVVFSDLPTGMQTGSDVQEEGLFVGYFLKTMTYTALNVKRSAPLLVGRMKAVASPAAAAAARPAVTRTEWFWIAAVGLPLIALSLAAMWLRLRQRGRSHVLPASQSTEAEIEDWYRSAPLGPPTNEA